MAVRHLKRYVSWVLKRRETSLVPICRGRWKIDGGLLLVREDRSGRTSGVPVVTPVA